MVIGSNPAEIENENKEFSSLKMVDVFDNDVMVKSLRCGNK